MRKTIIPELDIVITSKCISNCIYCSQNASLDGKDMSRENIYKLLGNARDIGIKEVHFTGGEPFCHSEIVNVIKDALSLSIKPKIATSGAGCTKQKLQKLRSLGMIWLGISIDSLDQETFFNHRKRKHAHTESFNTFKNAVEMGFNTEIMTVVLDDNIDEVPKLSQWLFDNGARQHTLFFPSPMGRARSITTQFPSIDRWIEMENAIRKLSLSGNPDVFCIKFETPVFDLKSPLMRADCRIEKRNHILVREDGEVFPCALLLRTEYSIGNVFEKSFSDIIHNSSSWDFFKKSRKAMCLECSHLDLCKGGCLAHRLLLGKEANEPDPRCSKMNIENGRFPMCIIHYEKHF